MTPFPRCAVPVTQCAGSLYPRPFYGNLGSLAGLEWPGPAGGSAFPQRVLLHRSRRDRHFRARNVGGSDFASGMKTHDTYPPPEPPADPGTDPPPHDPAMCRFNELLDEVIEADDAIATAMARRARAVDALRMHSEEMTETRPEVDTAAEKGWNAATCARRELQFELAAALTMSENAVRNLLSDSRFLVHELPATTAALERGAISFPHARVMLDNSVSVRRRRARRSRRRSSLSPRRSPS